MIIKILALVSLIKISIVEDRPLLCSGLYAFVTFCVGLFAVMVGNAPIAALLLMTLFRFGLSFAYFWLLSRVGGFFWWLVMVVGVVVLILFA